MGDKRPVMPRDVKLAPGERPVLGSRTLVQPPMSDLQELWLRVNERELVRMGAATWDSAVEFLGFYKEILRRIVHLQGQDEDTRLWAVEKLCDAERDLSRMIGKPWFQ